MASYGCLHEWAGLLGNQKAAGLLQAILNEEKAANLGLTKLAVAKSNQEALCATCSSDKTEQPKDTAEKKAAKITATRLPMAAGVH